MSGPDRAPELLAIGEGVWAWVQPGGGPGVSNAGVIEDEDGLTVVDTLMVRSQWEPFAAAVGELDRIVRRVVLTHAHIDHVGGTTAFRNAAVYGSPVTSELLDQELALDAYRIFMPSFAAEFDDLAEIGTRPVSHLVEDAAALTPRAEVLPAPGHTPGDVMVLVPDADVCFAGDVCSFGVTPLAFQGDPAAWADVLEAVAELATTIVPGHGRIGTEGDVRELQAYLRACVAAAGTVGALPSGPWDAWTGRELGDAINVERAALLAQGRDEIPTAMLRAITSGAC
jgi:cyclase